MISPVGSNQKQFAKSTCISTWFHPLNSTRFQQLVSTWFHQLDPIKNCLQNLHVFQPDFTHWIQPDFNSWFHHDFTGWIQLKMVCKIYMYFDQISPLDSTRFQSCMPAGNHSPLRNLFHKETTVFQPDKGRCQEVWRSRGFVVLVVSLLIWMIRGKNWGRFTWISQISRCSISFVYPYL